MGEAIIIERDTQQINPYDTCIVDDDNLPLNNTRNPWNTGGSVFRVDRME